MEAAVWEVIKKWLSTLPWEFPKLGSLGNVGSVWHAYLIASVVAILLRRRHECTGFCSVFVGGGGGGGCFFIHIYFICVTI